MAGSSFEPTLKMAVNAKRGLKLRLKFNRGGTMVGVNRAKQLAERSGLDRADVKSMASYFARHAVDKDAKSSTWGDALIRRRASSHGCFGAAMKARHGLSGTAPASLTNLSLEAQAMHSAVARRNR